MGIECKHVHFLANVHTVLQRSYTLDISAVLHTEKLHTSGEADSVTCQLTHF